MAFVRLRDQPEDKRGPEQRTPEWFEARKGRMTGSRPGSIMFEVTDEESYNLMWAQIFGDGPKTEFSKEQQAKVDWGREKEDEACLKYIELMPGTIVYECSVIQHPTMDWIAASPDGYIVRLAHENGVIKTPHEVVERAAFEIKCPGSHLRDTEGNVMPDAMMKFLKKKQNPAYYYLAQCHMEMVALGTPINYFYMWTPWYSRVWKITFDQSYWEQTIQVLKAFKERNLPFPVLKSKIDQWIQTSRSICQKIKPHQSFEHAPEGAIVHSIEKATKKLPTQQVVSTSSVTKWGWYEQKDNELLTKMFG